MTLIRVSGLRGRGALLVRFLDFLLPFFPKCIGAIEQIYSDLTSLRYELVSMFLQRSLCVTSRR